MVCGIYFPRRTLSTKIIVEGFLNQFQFTLDSVKFHIKSLKEGSKTDQYMVQNLMWSRLYLRITFSNDILHKVLKMVPLTETVTEVYDATMNAIIFFLKIICGLICTI